MDNIFLQAMNNNANLGNLFQHKAMGDVANLGHGLSSGIVNTAGYVARPEFAKYTRQWTSPLSAIGNVFDFGEDVFRNTGTLMKKTGQMLPGGASPTDNEGYFQYGWGKTPIADSLMNRVLPNFMGDFGDYGS